MVELYALNNDPQLNQEYEWKGWRPDIYIKCGNDFFHIIVFDIFRLNQDFEAEIEEKGYYLPEPGMVIVNKVNLNEIKRCVERLVKVGYFDCFKPVSAQELSQINLVKV